MTVLTGSSLGLVEAPLVLPVLPMHGSGHRGGTDLQPDPEQDLVVRQIRQVVDAVARLLLGRPAAAEVQAVEQRLAAVARDALGIDVDLLARVAPASVLRVLGTPDRISGYVDVLEAQLSLARSAGEAVRAAALTRRLGELRSLAAARA